MPFTTTHGNTQRRLFRGKGGATDGRLPPKKNRRVKVKYHPSEGQDDKEASHPNGLDENESSRLDDEIDQINDFDLQIDNQSLQSHPAQTEIDHLQKRIRNIALSLQSSRGLSNPQIWYTNVLLAVKNCVVEWRGICIFHFSEGDMSLAGSLAENAVVAEGACGARDVHHSKTDGIPDNILQTTSTQVYNLLQVAMQSGPLTGSNPGYFKRCGSEVASIALGFLMEIVALARGEGGVEVEIVKYEASFGMDDDGVGGADDEINRGGGIDNIDSAVDEDECTTVKGKYVESAVDTVSCDAHADEADRVCSDGSKSNVVDSALGEDVECNSDSTSCSDDSSHSDCSNSSNSSSNHEQRNTTNETPSTNHYESSKSQTIQALQTLRFSPKQCQRIHEWIINAHKAVEANKPPSKSALKLQSQKSKKQKMKELKMERKLKKKKRGGGK